MKGKLIYDERNGYSYERDGVRYDLLEGKCLNGTASSGICFAIRTSDEAGYEDVYNWFFLDGDDPKRLLQRCDEFLTNEPSAEKKIVELKEEKKELNTKIQSLEKEVKELRVALLKATRDKESKTDDIRLSMKTFYDLVGEILGHDDEDEISMEKDIDNHDVTVHFHGLYCNCYDGASAYNNIIEGIKEVAEEMEDVKGAGNFFCPFIY